ncbi:hypothetical protein H6F96_09340 [Microcoleus sp. FACHB-53]|nr:hypothetical protein [Microcoleus sp. FACHB-53]MBD2125809.1 hypothetical protein [Microcoleus sp. FACHB-1]
MLGRGFNHTAAVGVNLCSSYRIGEGDRASSQLPPAMLMQQASMLVKSGWN